MNMKRSLAFLLAVLMCLSLCACGRANSANPNYKEAAYEMSSAGMPAPMAMNAAYDYDMNYEDAGFAMMSMAASETAARGSDSDARTDAPEENPEKIIYSGDATVETTEFEKSVAALEKMIAEAGGFIESSSVNGNNYYDSSRGYTSKRSANYTLRVPSEKFAALMSSLSDIGNVPYTHTYTENVTAEYYDVQARLKALQAQEARLLEMMEIAETVEDIITIEDKLTDVRYRIDSFQSSLNNWDRRVAYSTLSITVKEVQVYTPATVTKISYGEELSRAFTDALKNAGQFFKDLLVFLVSAIPTLVILAVLFFVFRPLLKKLCQKAKARREARAAQKAAKKAQREKNYIEADKM
ncbi:MAG: DUF4349 domain-containing protein [Oscillospiraceae bacterium]|nr:DUF4349 domain-containing protein [Oscillospiraceae bacterium]